MTDTSEVPPPPSRPSRLLTVVAVGWLLLAGYLLLTTSTEVLATGGQDQVRHLVLFAFVGLSLTAALSRLQPAWKGPVVAIAVGALVAIATEAVQGLAVDGREAQWSDLLADLVGVILGAGIAVAVGRVARRSSGRWLALLGGCGLVITSLTVGFVALEIEQRLECRDHEGDVAVSRTVGVPPGEVLFDLHDGELATVSGRSGPDGWGERPPLVVDAGGRAVADFDGESVITAPPQTAAEMACGVFRQDELTALVVFTPADAARTGPARLFSVSTGTMRDEIDFHVAQQADGLSIRVRTTDDHLFTTIAPDVITSTDPHALVVTIAGGRVAVYGPTGELFEDSVRGTSLAGWSDDFFVTVGDEHTGGRSFTGTIDTVTISNEALDQAGAVALLAELSS